MKEKNHVGRPTNEEVANRKKKKAIKYSLLIILFTFLVGGIFLYFNRDNIDFSSLMGNSSKEIEKKTFTRSEMQKIIVSTALSYLYNGINSGYGQYSMDKSGTFNWRTFNQGPEMVNRASRYYIDCSSFVSSVYIHSLGYDFSEYYELSNSKIFFNSNYLDTKKDINNYQLAYKYLGKTMATSFFAKIGVEKKEDPILAYNYVVTGNESEDVKNKIKGEIINSLESGDIVVYRIVKDDGTKAGHAMIYVENEFNSSGGFIHSTGSDYNFTKSTVGTESYSVRYNDISKLTDNIFSEKTSKEGASFTILRPINKYCVEDKCTIPTCNDIDCGINYLNNNAEARVDLKNLRIEQYAKIEKQNIDYNANLTTTTGTTEFSKTLSKYNSVNVGDNITYNVYFLNRSKMTYCTSDTYDNKNGCKSSYNMVITNKIPDNTKFISCTRNCKYDSKTKIVTWENVSLGFDKNYEKTYSYTVQVTEEKDILNEGIKIETKEGNSLQFAPIKTKVNPTINGININLLMEKVDKFKSLNESEKIKYNSSSTEYKSNLNDITKIEVSQKGFIQMIYYNMLGIDLGDIKAINIRDAIFNNDGDGYYTKKTDDEITSLTKNEYKKINKMLVTGLHGGRLLKGNENKDRAQYIRAADLEVGDIIVFLYGDSEKYMSTYMFYGLEDNDREKPIFVRFESSGENGKIVFYDNSNKEKSGTSFFKELYSKNLFVVLRPSKLGTTVKYEYNGGAEGIDSYVAYDKYKNLVTPTRDGYKFFCWTTDSSLKNCISNDKTLDSVEYHKLYAKWEKENTVAINKYSYDNNKKYIDKIDINTTVDSFKKNIKLNEGYSIEVDYKNVNGKNILYTGSKTKIYNNNNLIVEYTNIIRGEVTGDGKINYLDYVTVYNHIQKIKKPESPKKELINEYLISADISEDGKVSYLDYVKIYNKIKELKGGNN